MSDLPDQVRAMMQAVHNMHILATVDAEGQPHMRWMGALIEDPEHPWTFYLACGRNSRKMGQIAANANAQLLFTKQDTWEVATLSGTAEALDRLEIRQRLLDAVPQIRRYYSSADDPAMGVIKFTTRCLELLSMATHKTECFVFD